MNDPRLWTVDDAIRHAMSAFRAKRGERTIWAGRRRVKVRTAGERVLYLPNGHHVKVSVDDSGVATHVEDTDQLHAIVRPKPIQSPFLMPAPSARVDASARPRPIATKWRSRK